MGKWNSHNLSVRVGFLCLGHSNWTILVCKFFKIRTFILEANSQPECESGISVPGTRAIVHLRNNVFIKK